MTGLSEQGNHLGLERWLTKLTSAIRAEFERAHHTYGAPRIHAALKAANISWSPMRVARLMKTAGIVARRKRTYKVTTNRKHDLPVAPNVVNRQFVAERTNQKWLANITYSAAREGWLYLAGVLDVYWRRIIGWAMDKTENQELVTRALEMALRGRKPNDDLLNHSDRGSQYAANAYQQKLRERGIVISMSRRANCYDNSMLESFWSSLKTVSVTEVFSTRARAGDC